MALLFLPEKILEQENREQMRYTEQQSLTQIRFVQFTGL